MRALTRVSGCCVFTAALLAVVSVPHDVFVLFWINESDLELTLWMVNRSWIIASNLALPLILAVGPAPVFFFQREKNRLFGVVAGFAKIRFSIACLYSCEFSYDYFHFSVAANRHANDLTAKLSQLN